MLRSFGTDPSLVTPGTDQHAAPYAHKTKGMYHSMQFSAVGLEMGLAVAIGAFFGRWLDGKLGTAPWMLLVFLFVGIAAGFRGVLRAVRAADRLADANERAAAAAAAMPPPAAKASHGRP